MISNNISTIPNFTSQAQLFIPIMHHRLSGDPNKKISISKSQSVTKPSIVPVDEADADCITLEDFLALLDARISAEFAYRNEITQLKDNLCEKFNKLCDGTTDEDYIKFVRDQRQRLINTLIDETKIDQKAIAEQFYNDMMNGMDEKALDLKNFNETVNVLLWKPLLTPLPIGALDQLEKLLDGLENDKSNIKIEEMTTQLMNYMQTYLKAKDVNDTDYESSEDMRTVFEGLVKGRQTCNVEVRRAESEKIINEFKSQCIEKVTLIYTADFFAETESKLDYDGLILYSSIEESNDEKAFNKIKKTVDLLSLEVSRGINYEKMAKCLSNIKSLKSLSLKLWNNMIGAEAAKLLLSALGELKSISNLNLDFTLNNIEVEGAKVISDALSELKNISTLELNLSNNAIGAEGAKMLSSALIEMKNVSTLNLNLENNKIGGDGIKAILIAVKELKKISTLNLNFRYTECGEEGLIAAFPALGELKSISMLNLDLTSNDIAEQVAKAISAALIELKNISTLNLSFESNKIRDEGVKSISAALVELKNISTLNLSFQGNEVGAEGVKALSAGLSGLTNLSSLNLNLECNYEVGEEGGKAMAAALKGLKNISTLCLNLWSNGIKVDGAKALSSALSELKNISTLNLKLPYNDFGYEGVKAILASLKELKSISSLNLNVQGNEIGVEGVKALPPAFKELEHIPYLCLDLGNIPMRNEDEVLLQDLQNAYPNYRISYWISPIPQAEG